ncbi:hypothetical protein [Halorubrum sp. BV1]|nr:hypothetical protein [Halorubrum sp. BV1]
MSADPDRPTDEQWGALAAVGLGYAAAVGLVFALVFLGPFLVVVGA